MPKRKKSYSNDSEQEKEEEEESKGRFKKKINEQSNIIKLSKKKNPEKNNFINNPDEIIESLNDEVQKLKKIISEKEKAMQELKKEISDNKKQFKEFNEKMKFKENELNQLSYNYENLLKEHDNLKKQLQEISNNNNNVPKINNIMNNNNFNNNIFRNNPSNNTNINNNINNMNFGKNNNVKIKLNPKKNAIQPIEKYKKPTLIGLQNIGATCFMNATLQCLSQTKRLTNYFLNEEHLPTIINNNIALNNPNQLQLSPVYFELLENLWNKEGESYYAPYNFMNRINDMNPLFKKGEAGDAKDFIIYILEQMHKELKKPLNLNNVNQNLPINQYDQNITLMNFFNEFSKETSILSDLFFGFNETTNICSNCKFIYNSQNKPNPICYNYGIFNLLIFPLEEIKKYKNNMNLMNLQSFYQGPTNNVSMDDCFIYNEKTDFFTGDNKNYCNLCKQLCDSQYTSKIYVSPNILILILNRGKGNMYKVNLDFTMKLDITNYVILKENSRIIYNLYGVITHLGESGPNAHFVASCKSPVDNKWYRYNDAQVSPIQDFKRDVYNFGIPYILFYEKEN